MSKRDRLKIFIRHLISAKVAKNQKDLGIKLGYESESYFSQIINGHTSEPTDFIEKLKSLEPLLNIEWLETGKGEMLSSSHTIISGDITVTGNGNTNIGHGNTYINDTGNNDDATYIEVEEVERAPILSATLARAPQVDVLEAVSEKVDELEKAPVGVFNAPVSVWYRVQDESLAPKYEVGDLLALWAYPKGEEDPIPGKMYGINTSTNGLIVRRLFPQEDGGYIAKAANREEFPDYRIKPGNVVQIYKIMLMVRF
jgi:transcriptional regulator with XRE-family HTH domain